MQNILLPRQRLFQGVELTGQQQRIHVVPQPSFKAQFDERLIAMQKDEFNIRMKTAPSGVLAELVLREPETPITTMAGQAVCRLESDCINHGLRFVELAF